MNKKLKLKDLSDKNLLRLMVLFKETLIDVYHNEYQTPYYVNIVDKAMEDKIHAEHNLISYLNKTLTNKNNK